MARIRKSDGTTVEVPDVDVWGVPPTEAEQVLIDRKALAPVARDQFAIVLAAMGVISGTEAKDFAGGNELPAFAEVAISESAMSDLDKIAAEIKALSVAIIHRDNPIVEVMRVAKGLTDLEVDELFKLAAGIT